TFLESFATVLLERGLYFYTHERLAFSDAANLWLALAFGVAYAGGAMACHRLTQKWGEKLLLWISVAAQMALHGAMAAVAQTGALTAAILLAFPLVGLGNGLKWPVVESYISAGLPPEHTLRAIGRFNVAWAVTVPLAVWAAGPMIAWPWPWLLFAAAAAVNVVTLILMRPLPPMPTHLEPDHPHRPAPQELRRYAAMLAGSRWSMLAGYILLFLLAPLMPRIFADLGLSVQRATQLAAMLDVMRLLVFLVMG